MGRCWGCCQENCGYSYCSCSCHDGDEKLNAEREQRVKYKALEEANRRAGEMVKKASDWTIADRYFYQAGPLPEDRYDLESKVASTLKGYLRSPCKKHRTYKALRKPRSGCEECWRFYIKTNP